MDTGVETMKRKAFFDCFQGDQIGRFFAHWVIVYFKPFFENYKRRHNLWRTLFPCKNHTLILTKMGWGAFWAIFNKLIWSP
jgi:hypothetical protein